MYREAFAFWLTCKVHHLSLHYIKRYCTWQVIYFIDQERCTYKCSASNGEPRLRRGRLLQVYKK
jgi:hypothetical protein